MADANVAANQRFAADDYLGKVNLGIGINVGADGGPWMAQTMYRACRDEGANPDELGKYSAPSQDLAAGVLLDLLGVPAEYHSQMVVRFVSDGGTGALDTIIRVHNIFSPAAGGICVQPSSWPGYKSLAKCYGIKCLDKKVPLDWDWEKNKEGYYYMTPGLDILQPVHNGTGILPSENGLSMCVTFAFEEGRFGWNRWQVIDLPYLGFDYPEEEYDMAIKKSAACIHAYLKASAPFALAWSPTKIFGTFSSRPGGAVVFFCPDEGDKKKIEADLATATRGRGCGFVNLSTNALIWALEDFPEKLKADHAAILQRLAQANADWRHHGSDRLHPYFGKGYGGLFRILPVQEGAVESLAADHIHVVDASNPEAGPRIRINVMGLPHDDRTESIVHAVEACTRD